MTTATETRLPCSKETRRILSDFKRSPDNWDETLRRVASLARAYEAERQATETPKDAHLPERPRDETQGS